MKARIVYKQLYEELFVYGVFLSDESLDSALDILAEKELDEAREDRKELLNWYNHTHVPWAKHNKIEPTWPPRLDMSILEYSKTLFAVHSLEADEILDDVL